MISSDNSTGAGSARPAPTEPGAAEPGAARPGAAEPGRRSPLEHRILNLLRQGLPLSAKPYDDIARRLDCQVAEVIAHLQALHRDGIVRRIAALPGDAIGTMDGDILTVWDIKDALVDDIAGKIAALPFVTQCYRRPRDLPRWRYNLFAAVRGDDEDEVRQHCLEIAALAGSACRARNILYDRRILKARTAAFH